MKYFLIAGEASGDQHAAHLMRALMSYDNEAEFCFLGGDEMAKIGGEPEIHIDEMAFMGFTQLLGHLGKIRSNFKKARQALVDYQPDVLILIDYPGFNLRMAKWAKKQGLKVYYYIAPKAWAWNSKRVFTLKAYTDKVYSILPFEKDFFNRFGLHTEYVGNPVQEEIARKYPETENADKDKSRIIALLPGSRKQEIEYVLPVMLDLMSQFEEYSFMIAGMKVHDELYKRFVGEKSQVSVDYSGSLSVLSRSVAALVTSGTATLETALMGIPQIVCYKTNKLSYQIAKKLIKVPYISLVNLILRSRAVPEMIQDNCTVDFLSEGLMKILPGGENRHDQLGITDLLRKEIGNVSVSDKLALLIINSLSAS